MKAADPEHLKQLIHQRLNELEAQSASGQQAQSAVELDQQAVGRLTLPSSEQNAASSLWFDSENFLTNDELIDTFLKEVDEEFLRAEAEDKPFLQAIIGYTLSAAGRHERARVQHLTHDFH